MVVTQSYYREKKKKTFSVSKQLVFMDFHYMQWGDNFRQ